MAVHYRSDARVGRKRGSCCARLTSAGSGSRSTVASDHEACKLQIWRWSLQKATYESAGEVEIQRFRGSRMIKFTWSPESDRVVVINTRLGEAECAFLEVKGNTFQQLVEQSNKLNSMKIVALAFAVYRTGIAVVFVDPANPSLRRVGFIGTDDLEVIPGTRSMQLSEDFQPNEVAFGPGDDQLTLRVGAASVPSICITETLHRCLHQRFGISSCA